MTLLPIVGRELRAASRRRSTWVWRCIAALVVTFFGTWLFFIMRNEPPATLAKALFGMLGAMALIFAAVSGSQFTADSVSREKREGTLGLLFLTDLKGFDVILGKLAATSLNSFYGLLAILPVLAIPLLIGGVSAGEFWRMSLVAINTLLMSLALGMLVSCFGRSARHCSGLTLAGILVLAVLLPFAGWWISDNTLWAGAQRWFALLSPGHAFSRVFDTTYRLAPSAFWWNMAAMHAVTWAFLAGASFAVTRTWKERPKASARVVRRKWAQWKYGSNDARAGYRRRALDVNPFYWMATRVRFKPALVWLTLLLLALGWFAGLKEYNRDWLTEGVYVMSVLLLNAVIKVWFASEACHQVAEDKQSGVLELLLSTPLTVRQVMDGQRLALQRQFLAPTVAVLVLQAIFVLAAAGADRTNQTFWLMLGLASMGMLIADLVALHFVGLWAAIRAPNPHVAASMTLFSILILPWILYALFLMFLVISSMSAPGPDPGWKLLLPVWFFIGIFVDILLAVACREQFLSRFRQLAAARFKSSRT
jgi:ABC-type Na+ efflux pump permease subunit